MTILDEPKVSDGGPTPPRRTLVRSGLAFLRNTWRGLTSMRTALVLLFLLALAAMPGALLPQTALNPPKTRQYIIDHGWWGRLLDRSQFFDVYGSVWFSAIYLLLFISLVGCLVPRTVEYVRQFTAKPVLTPRNLARLPHHARFILDAEPDVVLAATRQQMRGWRRIEREDGDTHSISAERGYLREIGNLVFHFALLGLVVAFALGKMFSYSGQIIVLANGSPTAQFCNAGVLSYDTFTPGLRVDGTQLDPFCVKVNSFSASYLADGQPNSYSANMQYQSGRDLETNTWRPYQLKVNSPLRTAGDRVYLLGHGYAPQFTVTFPNGQTETGLIQWKGDDPTTLLSEGATKFDPPDATDSQQQRTKQLAITGLLAPTGVIDDGVVSSVYPALDNPIASVLVYQGDLGNNSGIGQSIFSIDMNMVSKGRLNKVAQGNLSIGQSLVLPDGTRARFDKVEQWVDLQVSHDPTQVYVLVFAIFLLLGLVISLVIKRRRVWIRITPAGQPDSSSRTVIEIGGLARTDQAGYGEEFSKLSARLRMAADGAHGGKDT